MCKINLIHKYYLVRKNYHIVSAMNCKYLTNVLNVILPYPSIRSHANLF